MQILDPATGTGTFLAEVVKQINKNFEGQQGLWSNYVETNLLPRLNGFELLMASYAMAHLKLDLLLTETGYKPTANQRLRIFLTNSLEEHHPDSDTLFANWLSQEANEANHIKRDAPMMVVLGNPPYAVSSSNKGEWIQNLIADYKKDLNERKINLDDDYIKFIRYGQHFIDKNGSGILAYISNNSFIDGITHRQMRKHLLESFDKIYILDLHGNAKKKEVCADGSPDQNVFDIMQGVSINIFVKTAKKKKNELGEVFHFDLQGKREFKFKTLRENTLKSISWNKLDYSEPNYFFVLKNFDEIKTYEIGFKIDEIFFKKCSGVQTDRDNLFIDNNKENLIKKIKILLSKEHNGHFVYEYNINDSSGYNLLQRISNANFDSSKIQTINYRPFDLRNIYYDEKLISRAGYETNKNLLKSNIGLIAKRGFTEVNSIPCFLTLYISDRRGWSRPGMQGAESIFPLYLYPETNKQTELSEHRKSLESKIEEAKIISENFEIGFCKVEKMYQAIPNPDAEMKKYFKSQEAFGKKLKVNIDKFKQELNSLPSQTLFEEPTRTPNLNTEIVAKIAESLRLEFENEKTNNENTFAPIDILDYIYAVLHSPTYREKYKEFLKIDFPRVPYPKDKETFWQLVKLGGEIRQIHLLESPIIEKNITQYPIDGNHLVTKLKYESGKVYINETQYFDNVPEIAWNFYIGGYQPAQKWLKDRKGRMLNFEDILHYQKIVVALSETDRLMKKIDKIEIE